MAAQRRVKGPEAAQGAQRNSAARPGPEGEPPAEMAFTLRVLPNPRVEYVSPSSVALSGYTPE